MRYYQVTIGLETFSVRGLNLLEAKQIAQWCKMTRNFKGKTFVKFIGYSINGY